MSLPLDDSQKMNGSDVAWEIYEIGEPKPHGAIGEPRPYGWSWRCRIEGRIVRRGDIMYSSIQGAIEDAVAHGMRDPASAIRPA